MPDVIQQWWIQAGFAGFSFALLWLLQTTLKSILAELTKITTFMQTLVEQQDGGYRFVIDQLIASVKEGKHEGR